MTDSCGTSDIINVLIRGVFPLLSKFIFFLTFFIILRQDESDEMLSRGFKDQIYDVYRYLPPELQVCIEMLEIKFNSMF